MSTYTFICQCGYEQPEYVLPTTVYTEAFRCPYCKELMEIDREDINYIKKTFTENLL